MRSGVGVDLGASVIRVATADDGILAREASLLAVDRTSARVLALGNAAEDAAKKNVNAIVMRPFSRGLLARKNITKYVLSEVISALEAPLPAAVAVPCSFARESAETLFSLMREAHFPSATLVYSPVAAMIGCNISPDTDAVFVDIGASETGIILTIDGRIVFSDSIPIGGDQLDRAVIDFLFGKRGIRVAATAAEQLKIRVGSAWIDGDDTAVRISGQNTATGCEEVVTVFSSELMAAFETTLTILIDHICAAVRRVPLNRVESVFRNGIYLAGGGAALTGLDRLISALTGVHTTLVPQTADVVALGLSRIAALDPFDPTDAALISRVSAYTFG